MKKNMRSISKEPFKSLAAFGTLDERKLLRTLVRSEEEFISAFHVWAKEAQTQSWLRLAAVMMSDKSVLRHVIDYRGEKKSSTHGVLQVLEAFHDRMRAATEEEIAYLRTSPLDVLFSIDYQESKQ